MTAVLTTAIAFTCTPSFSYAKSVNIKQVDQKEEGRKRLDFDSAKKSHVKFNSPFAEIPKTMELWVNADAGNTNRQLLIGNYVYAKNCFALELTTDKQLRYVEFAYEAGKMVTGVDIKVNAEVTTGEWMLLSVVRNVEKNQIIILKNGEVISETQLNGTGTNVLQEEVPLDTPHYLGTDARKQSFLDAEISQVRLWEQSKTIEEIKNGMNAEINGTEEGLQHAYNLDINALNVVNTVIKDLKINGIHGVAHGFEFPDAPVYQKNGLDFSKNDKDLEMTSLFEEIPMTFETWVKVDSDKAGSRSVIAGNFFDAYAASIPLMNFEITANGEPRLYWNINKIETDYVAKGVNVYNGAWTHIAISCSVDPLNDKNTIFSTYINGELADSQSMNLTPVKLIQPMKIGEDTRYAQYLKGSMADLRIWSTTRTAEEIKQNFDAEVAADTNGLLGNWLLNEEVDGSYLDRSPNDNHVSSYWFDGDYMKKAEDGYETIAVIPDTQTMTYWAPSAYTTMTTWLKDHKDELGIKFAIHVGDIVNDNGYQSQWDNAVKSMSVLDGVLPFVFSPGNHDTAIQKVDGVWWGVRDTAMMNKNFPYSKYSEQEAFGGAYEVEKMDNTYSFFTVNNVDFMTISLEQNPRDEVLAWANRIAEENNDKKIIVSTHEYMNFDGKTTTEDTEGHLKFIGGSNSGSQLWEKFAKKHENIITVISGHIGYPDLIMNEAVGENGNTVQQVLCDAQFMDRDDVNNGSKKGLGMVMLMSFKEGSDDVHVNWYSTVRQQYFRSNNQFTSQMELQDTPESYIKFILKSAIDKAEEIMSSKDFAHLAPAVQGLIAKRYQEAEVVYEDKHATDEQCQEAWENLANALQYAGFMADKDTLKALIDDCNLIDLDNYEDGVAAFEEALLEANSVFNDSNALQERIDAAHSNLLVAKNGLKEKPSETVNKNALQAVIAVAQEAVDHAAQYADDDNWKEMIRLLAEAKELMEKVDASQAEVDAVTGKLAAAYENIRLLADEKLLAQLEDFIQITASINRANYSQENLKRIDDAAAQAIAMYANKDFTEAEYETFSKTMASILRIIEHEKLTPKPTDTKKEQPTKDGKQTIPATNDATNMAGGLLALAASAVMIVSIAKKKKESETV